MTKLRWGILSTAKIGLEHVIPAMQRGQLTTVNAIASRDLSKAQQAASKLGIPNAYGSYEELLADPEIDAIYNPLPNHLHIPWTAKAAEAGKHVLCEKPLSLTAAEAEALLEVRDRTGVQIAEAFMVNSHPQWQRVRALLEAGRIGELRAISGVYSYFNNDPANVRSKVEWGGGGLMDIGCYLIHLSRYAFRQEPRRVVGLIERDPQLGIDRLASALLDFPGGQTAMTCGTQLLPHQQIQILGTRGCITLEIPINALPDRPARLTLDSSGDLRGAGITTETIPACDQYTLQGDDFARAVFEGSPVQVPLEDSIQNMAVIDAIFKSAESGQWEAPRQFS
ncbi:MAG: Gfo/Idh/MocA family oxidoreductase [Terracidiphilus sp.]